MSVPRDATRTRLRRCGLARKCRSVVSECTTSDGVANCHAGRRHHRDRLRADSLATAVSASVARADTEAKGRLPRPRALFIYARGMGTLFVAGANTGAAEMLRLVGAVNVGAPLEGYKPFTAEAVATSGAEVIVLPEKGLRSLGGIEALLALPGMSQTPAARARRVVTVDDALLLGSGPRLPEGIQRLSRAIAASLGTTAAAAAMR